MPQVKLDYQKFEKNLLENVPALENMDAAQKSEVSKKIKESVDDSKSPLDTDVWIYRIIVLVLGLVILLTVGGIMFVYNKEGSTIPETLTALGSGALGALAGLLAPSPRQTNGG